MFTVLLQYIQINRPNILHATSKKYYIMNKSTTFISVIFSFMLGYFAMHESLAQVSFGDAININQDWTFSRGDHPEAAQPEFNDSRWRRLNLPHDWSVEGPYSPDLASCTGYLPGGIGWYRKTLTIPEAMKDKKVYIYFEGVYRDGGVYINGTSLGMRPNGYISYMYELTPYIRYGMDNVVSVRVDHSQSADSRWYTGSGIYRDVYLIYANPIHIDQWGVYYTTPEVSEEQATVQVQTTIINKSIETATIMVGQTLKAGQASSSKEQYVLAETSENIVISAGEKREITQVLTIPEPLLWSVAHPNLYTLNTALVKDGALIDDNNTTVGIRTLDFDPNTGFYLNGENLKVKGVCLHHDAGSLGAAVPREVWKRRLLALKELGTNAIRTSHNPQAPVLYELCDELGFLVINEAFDEWEYPKKKWLEGWNVGTPGFQGHYEFFEEWGEIDLRDMILRDRNHPSVFMWSIGNEVDYPNDPYSHPILDEEGIDQQHTRGYLPDAPDAMRLGGIAERLAAVVRQYDPTRPVTAGLAGPVMSNVTGYPEALDVVGYNYTERRYALDHATYPDRILYGSENRHDVNAWKAVRDNDFIFGQFLWTGINYLGESHRWPSRGFTSGLLDMAGFKKPSGWFRQSLWTDEPMVYIGTYPKRNNPNNLSINAHPVWNYNQGDTIRVVSYTNCDSARLILNGVQIDEEKVYDDDTGIIFWDIPFTPGKLEVEGLKNGIILARYEIETSKRPLSITANAWKQAIDSEYGVAQVEIQIVDEDGKPVFQSDDEITVSLSGPVSLLGLEASNHRDMGDYTTNSLRAFQGKLIAYIQATGETGKAYVTLNAPWLEGITIELVVE
jgi:beta-galactosidase